MVTRKLLFSMTDRDRENIALTMALYPNPDSMTAALRLTLETYIRNADPVAIEAARKTIRKIRKAEVK